MPDPRYPIGKFETPALPLGEAARARLIAEIAELPSRLAAAVRGLDDARLDRPYRPGGWTLRQVVHHLPDSHMNAYIRFRLALTEDTPPVKPYEEARWAELSDAASAPVGVSLTLLEALHSRWVTLLRSMKATDWARGYRHPELGVVSLDQALPLYAWHGRHHLAHITNALGR